jgi:putative Holliday junction resolvase
LRLLGIDFGFKRIGIAIAETEPEIITARPTVEASGTLKIDAEKLAKIAKQEQVDAVILGLPIEESGEEGKMARICRTLAGHISAAGLQVHLVDERMTSIEADNNLRNLHPLAQFPSRQESSGKRKGDLKASERRKLKDGEAARLILERFIAGHALPLDK